MKLDPGNENWMKAKYINPFIVAVNEVFAKSLDCSVTRSQVFASQNFTPLFDITGIIGMSGTAVGCVAISLSREVAIQATAWMTQQTPASEIDEDVADAVGEIANMIAGSSRAELGQDQLKITLPTVKIGKSYSIDFPTKSFPICIGFASKWGPLAIQVGLKALEEEES